MLDANKVKVVCAKNFYVPQPISHAQSVVGLELVPVAGSADALEIFVPVGIACFQSPDQTRWGEVVHMAFHPDLFEIYPARRYFDAYRDADRRQRHRVFDNE